MPGGYLNEIKVILFPKSLDKFIFVSFKQHVPGKCVKILQIIIDRQKVDSKTHRQTHTVYTV